MEYHCKQCGERIPDDAAHFRDYSRATGWSSCKLIRNPWPKTEDSNDGV